MKGQHIFESEKYYQQSVCLVEMLDEFIVFCVRENVRVGSVFSDSLLLWFLGGIVAIVDWMRTSFGTTAEAFQYWFALTYSRQCFSTFVISYALEMTENN